MINCKFSFTAVPPVIRGGLKNGDCRSAQSSNSNYLVDYAVNVPPVAAADLHAGMQIGVRIVSSHEGIDSGSGDWVIDNVRLDEEHQTLPLSVVNASFETPDLPPDGAQAGIPGWNINGPAAGVARNVGAAANRIADSDGDQIGWLKPIRTCESTLQFRDLAVAGDSYTTAFRMN